MQCHVACLVFVLCVARIGVSFMLDSQSTNMANVTYALHQLQTEVSILKGMVTTLQESSPSCAATIKRPNPAFMATLSTTDLSCPGGAPLIFDREHLDTSNSYDIRHGMFRAPVNGTYVFTTTLTARDLVFIDVKMVKNLSTNQIGHHFNDNRGTRDLWNQSSTTIVVELAAGDDVWLICISSV